MPDSLQEQIENWRYQPISQYDFPHVYEPFLQDSYQYVLHGMGFAQELGYNASSYNQQGMADNIAVRNQKITQQLLTQLPTNRQLMEQLKKHSFQTI